MDLQEPVGINVPDSLRKAAWKLKQNPMPRFASEASDLVASVDSLTLLVELELSRSVSSWRLDQILVIPSWGRSKSWRPPPEGHRCRQEGYGTNAHNQPPHGWVYLRFRSGSRWGILGQVQSNLCLIKTQKKLPFWHTQLSRTAVSWRRY